MRNGGEREPLSNLLVLLVVDPYAAEGCEAVRAGYFR